MHPIPQHHDGGGRPDRNQGYRVLGGILIGGLIGMMAGMFWLSLPGILIGAATGAFVTLLAPSRVTLAMLGGFVAGLGVYWGTALWGFGGATAGAPAMSPWPASLLTGLGVAAVTTVLAACPWAAPGHRHLGWNATIAAVAPLLLPAAGLGALLFVTREVDAEARKAARSLDAIIAAQRRDEAQRDAREKERLRTGTVRLATVLGAYRFPRAASETTAPDGMSLFLDLHESPTAAAAYYERVMGKPFPIRPRFDGGSGEAYSAAPIIPGFGRVNLYVFPPGTEPAREKTRVVIAPY